MSLTLENYLSDSEVATPPNGFLRVYTVGSSVRYKDSNGSVSTLSTGITREEVEDLLSNSFTDSSNIEWTYDDALNSYSCIVKQSILDDINNSIALKANSADLSTVALTGSYNDLTDKPSVGVFGSCFGEASNDTYITHNDNDPLYEYVLLQSVCDAGKYRIGVTVSWNMSTTVRNFVAELYAGANFIGKLELETKDSGTDVRNWDTSFFYYTHTGGQLDIGMYVGPESSGDTARIYYGGIEKWRVQ